MKIGSHYRIREVSRLDWDYCARELNLRQHELNKRIGSRIERLPETAKAVAVDMSKRDDITAP